MQSRSPRRSDSPRAAVAGSIRKVTLELAARRALEPLESRVLLALNLANAAFASAVSYPAGTKPNAIATADFNHDGVPDVAVSSDAAGANNASFLLGSGTGGFFAPQA